MAIVDTFRHIAGYDKGSRILSGTIASRDHSGRGATLDDRYETLVRALDNPPAPCDANGLTDDGE